jgi:hypothetical protein
VIRNSDSAVMNRSFFGSDGLVEFDSKQDGGTFFFDRLGGGTFFNLSEAGGFFVNDGIGSGTTGDSGGIFLESDDPGGIFLDANSGGVYLDGHGAALNVAYSTPGDEPEIFLSANQVVFDGLNATLVDDDDLPEGGFALWFDPSNGNLNAVGKLTGGSVVTATIATLI